jgi:hypothetical protein
MSGLGLALALASDCVERGVRATDEVKAVAHDPRVGKRRADRLPVGLGRVDRDDLDPGADVLRQPEQPPLDHPALAAIEHLDHPPAIHIRDHRRELPAMAVMRLIQRQAPGRPVLPASLELITAA